MEDWAEIRRLHMAEGMAIKAIVRRTGTSRNAVRRALASDEPPSYSRPAKGSVLDAVEPAIRELLRRLPDDAGDGDRRAARLAARPDDPEGPGAPAAAVLPAAGPVLAHRVRPGPPGPVRPVVPARAGPAGCRAGRLTAGAGDDQRLLADAVGADDPFTHRAGPDRRALAAVDRDGCGPAAAGVGQRGRGRFLAAREADPDRAVRVLPRQPGDRGAPVPAPRSRGQGADRAQQPLPGDLVPARAHVHRPR